jgi:hypothetical protein
VAFLKAVRDRAGVQTEVQVERLKVEEEKIEG